MKLFGHPDSGHAYKVRLMLTLAGMTHDYEVVDIFAPRDQRPPEFRDNARFNEVPLLLDDGVGFVQSNAILLHLAEHTGEWGAQSPLVHHRCREWLMWEANKIGMCLPQLRARHKFDDQSVNDGALDWLRARFEHDIALLESALSDGREWMVETELPTIADFSLCGYLYFAEEAHVSLPPKVTEWLERLAVQPGWQHPYQLMVK